ncbi:hypothetical protein ASPZODRAFT_140775 [Penicilliopsis zonata CBS 506.65]|uniref:HNH nuclease domain-containing protein n=1 Tax=Penicilliopsis zonata CBS 506.65 TaxID=1073090 RepID=A0A1L9SMZ5_9EURO|nr:hypothetical protein ASPZODRAFT_140775 [Penicilliopsis zonata CBS 506.65]OJJ48483.1 hypothetical protein ASPZODRAFT_140775 [Penicilliopsis zonata CBS 506.65]
MWCLDHNQVKTAHLVPKSLASDEVPYLFGVGEVALTDLRKCKEIAQQMGNNIVRLQDIDNRELIFRTDNRPARRFLYFRMRLDDKVNKNDFWLTIGRYLHRSTLVSLARCISGCNDAGMVLSVDSRDAITVSIRERENTETSGDDEMNNMEE